MRIVPRLRFDRVLPLLALLAGAPAVALSLVLLWAGPFEPHVRWTLGSLAVGAWLGFVWMLHERLIRPLQTLSNMLAALREGDYSMRARAAQVEDALGLVSYEVNTLGDTLREQRLEVLEATTLLRRVMDEIDVAVFAFDADGHLRLVNRAAERLLGRSAESLAGRSAASLGLAECFTGDSPRVMEVAFPGTVGRWEVRRSRFRQEGRPHELLVLTDLSRVLAEEERRAWQRLVRVLGHEINNSLTPIRSIAASLRAGLARGGVRASTEAPAASGAAPGSGGPSAGETAPASGTAHPGEPGSDGGAPVAPSAAAGGVPSREDLERGLAVIAGRSEALQRFMSSYARLTRLPPPERAPLDVEEWIRRVVALETRLPIAIRPGRPATISGDGDQLDQLLINLVGNAVDATRETGGGVDVSWSVAATHVEVEVRDEGPGVSSTTNLFVPFFTTKPDGSGIGLALGRRIAEAHGGTLTLSNRPERRGCVARVRLPREPSGPPELPDTPGAGAAGPRGRPGQPR